MEIKAKSFRFGQIWEVLSIDGTIHFLIKDVLSYFGYAPSSQAIVTGNINEDDSIIISGDQIKHLKHVKNRGTAINIQGLMDFVASRQDRDRVKKGQELMDWVFEKVIEDMKKVGRTKSQENDHEFDLFGASLQGQVDQLNRKVKEMDHLLKQAERRIRELEKKNKLWELESAVDRTGDKKMFDAETVISLIEKMR